MRLTIVLCICLVALSWAGPGRAAQPRCDRASAIAVTVEAILYDPNAYVGKCVVVKGLLASRSLFPDVESLYHARNAPAYSSQVAVYAGYDDVGDRLWSDRSLVEFVGKVTTCSLMWSEAERDAEEANKAQKDGIFSVPFIAGVCHYTDIPAIVVSERKNLDGTVRLKGDKALQLYGDIDIVRGRSAGFTAVTQRAEKWFDAVRRGDGEAAIPGKEEWKASSRTELLDRQSSPARFLIGRPRVPDIVYFRRSDRHRAHRSEQATYACVCKTDSCAGHWPIAAMDAHNHEADWPYYCIEIASNGDIDSY